MFFILTTIAYIAFLILLTYLGKKGKRVLIGRLIASTLTISVLAGIIVMVVEWWKTGNLAILITTASNLALLITVVATNDVIFRIQNRFVKNTYVVLIIAFSITAFLYITTFPTNLKLGATSALGGLILAIIACAPYVYRSFIKEPVEAEERDERLRASAKRAQEMRELFMPEGQSARNEMFRPLPGDFDGDVLEPRVRRGSVKKETEFKDWLLKGNDPKEFDWGIKDEE